MFTDMRDIMLNQASHVTRCHMYVSSSNSRARKKETCYSRSYEGNHESFETVDTEGYSTDTSFMDQVILLRFK